MPCCIRPMPLVAGLLRVCAPRLNPSRRNDILLEDKKASRAGSRPRAGSEDCRQLRHDRGIPRRPQSWAENGLHTADFMCCEDALLEPFRGKCKVQMMRDGNVYITELPKRVRNKALFRDDNCSLSQGRDGR